MVPEEAFEATSTVMVLVPFPETIENPMGNVHT